MEENPFIDVDEKEVEEDRNEDEDEDYEGWAAIPAEEELNLGSYASEAYASLL